MWPKRFEAAFADRFGGRDELIKVHHWLLAVGLHVSPVKKVLIGSDGWLYFSGNDGRLIDRDFRGVVDDRPDEIADAARELKRRHDLLAQRGIRYVLLALPDKPSIYPEHLPAWMHRAEHTRLDRLLAALAAYPDITVGDPRSELIAAKQSAQVFYRTDSHWNYAGAVVAYAKLMQRLRILMPDVDAAPRRSPRISRETI